VIGIQSSGDVFADNFAILFHNTRGLCELLQLQLQHAYCLPILQYAIASVRLSVNQERMLNVCWNNVYRKILDFHKWESSSVFIHGLGRLNFTHIRLLLIIKLYKGLMLLNNSTINALVNMFCVSTEGNCLASEIGLSLKEPTYKLIAQVYKLFDLYCDTKK